MKKIDEYGITEYSWWIKLLIPAVLLYIYIQVAGYYLWTFEHQVGNIKTIDDARWVIQMAASTIGFGDFYPVTSAGRDLVASSFYTGIALLGLIAGVIGDLLGGFTDNSVQNRELRKQNQDILDTLKELK